MKYRLIQVPKTIKHNTSLTFEILNQFFWKYSILKSVQPNFKAKIYYGTMNHNYLSLMCQHENTQVLMTTHVYGNI